MNVLVWVEAARLRTLPASLIPVMVGGTLAWQHEQLYWPATVVALSCAVLIQIATNFANDYFDYRSGADADDRVGFTRASSSGAISPGTMLTTALSTFFAAFLLGLYLVLHAGLPILVTGILAIAAGIMYTGGPFPLAYNGLGDLFVFLFFGFAAVTGTYYVNTLQWSEQALWASVAVGSLSTMILVANNYLDVHSDRRAGKNTLVVIFGERFARWQFTILALLPFTIPPHFFFREEYGFLIFLPMILLPWAIYIIRWFHVENRKEAFNDILVQTAQFMTAFGILFSAGIALG